MERALEILKRHWGHTRFRPEQRGPIQSLIKGRDTLCVLPTGGGKTLCYQVPGIVRGGLCLVISPLIALMEDQMMTLKKRNITVEAIRSASGKRDAERIMDRATYGKLQFLYVSPERIQNPHFLERMQHWDVRTIAIDEAHCISQWGHDFRPAYRSITDLRPYFPNAVWGAYTATATKQVATDIVKQLHLTNFDTYQSNMRRQNLQWVVHTVGDPDQMILESIARINGTGLLYVSSRAQAELWADRLKRTDISAAAYHAGLEPRKRSLLQSKWVDDKIRVLCCTSAFGMGIDKPDVRWVFHAHIPQDIESYVQEAGRAGRDGLTATCVIFPSPATLNLTKLRIDDQFPSIESIQKVYQGIANAGQTAIGDLPDVPTVFDLSAWSKRQGVSERQVLGALQLLKQQGYIQWDVKPEEPLQITILEVLDVARIPSVYRTEIQPIIRALQTMAADNRQKQHFTVAPSDLTAVVGWKDEQRVKRGLQQLHEWRWIRWNMDSKSLMIQWKTPRQRTETIALDDMIYSERQRIVHAKWERMQAYLACENCRNMNIEKYFDEAPSANCEVCDLCVTHQPITDEEMLAGIPNNGIEAFQLICNEEPVKRNALLESLRKLEETGHITTQNERITKS